MSDQKDQAPNSPSQSTGLPIKKRYFAENNTSHDDFQIFDMNKKELQKQAYHNVLQAFFTETPEISSPRILIVKDLMKEWNIDQKTHAACMNSIKIDPMIQQLRNVSLEKPKITAVEGIGMKPKKEDMLKIRDQVLAPAKIQDGKVIVPEEEANLGSTCEDSPVPSWGQVSPTSLVGRWINIRMPGEIDYVSFFIRQYDAETETHYMEITALSKNNVEDPCNWIDLRHIPGKDIIWREGHPGLPVRKCFLKPGQTLLFETSTARKKKQLNEVGKTSTGIPIIREVDKGKSIVGAKSPMQ